MVWSADGRCENVGVIKKEASGLIVYTFSVREDVAARPEELSSLASPVITPVTGLG